MQTWFIFWVWHSVYPCLLNYWECLCGAVSAMTIYIGVAGNPGRRLRFLFSRVTFLYFLCYFEKAYFEDKTSSTWLVFVLVVLATPLFKRRFFSIKLFLIVIIYAWKLISNPILSFRPLECLVLVLPRLHLSKYVSLQNFAPIQVGKWNSPSE